MNSEYLGGVSVDIDSKKNGAKIGSPLGHLSQDRFIFSTEALGQITIWQFISSLMNMSMIRC